MTSPVLRITRDINDSWDEQATFEIVENDEGYWTSAYIYDGSYCEAFTEIPGDGAIDVHDIFNAGWTVFDELVSRRSADIIVEDPLEPIYGYADYTFRNPFD